MLSFYRYFYLYLLNALDKGTEGVNILISIYNTDKFLLQF